MSDLNFYQKRRKPILRKSFCAFIDILGFSDMITNSIKKGRSAREFSRFYKVQKKQLDKLNEDVKDGSLYMKVFTDNVILSYPYLDDMAQGETEFALVLWSVQAYQFEMALNGYFLRGGLTIDNLYIDDNIVYGPALLEAHFIEKNIAATPRIVLSDNVVTLVKKQTKFYMSAHQSPQNYTLLVDSDKQTFVHYLYCMIDGVDDSAPPWELLEKHKKQVMAAVRRNSADHKILSKYAWLVDYHNYFCDEVKKYPGYSDKYRIPDNLRFHQISRLVGRNG